jgi:activator of 2-hydroxyglutaryl-CoA dehydratase
MIENVVKGIVDGFKQNESKAKSNKPMPIVIAGGTSMPNGFVEMFKKCIDVLKVPFEIGNVYRAEEPLYAIASGCLLASEMHE